MGTELYATPPGIDPIIAGPVIKPLANVLGIKPLCGGDDDKPKVPLVDRLTNKLFAETQSVLNVYNRTFNDTLELAKRAAAEYGPAFSEATDAGRARELASFKRFAPEYVQAIDESDPMQGALRAATNREVLAGLEDPAGLDPSLRREIAEASRGAYAARGLARSPSSATAETYALGERGAQQRNQNIALALGAMQSNQRTVGDSYLAITGRPSQPQGTNFQSPNYTGGFNDLLNYQGQQIRFDTQAKLQKDATNKQFVSDIIGGVLGAAGGIGGAFI